MIKKTHSSSSNRIEPGEYKVTITSVVAKTTKETKKPMVEIMFETDTKKTIRDWFVQDNKWAMERLDKLKIAAGVHPGMASDTLLGKRVGIAVDNDKPKEDGSMLRKITGYGKESDVDEAANAFHNSPLNTNGKPVNVVPF